MAYSKLLLQVSAGWKHGDSVDEQAKSHPLLKPYKALSEKVHTHTAARGVVSFLQLLIVYTHLFK